MTDDFLDTEDNEDESEDSEDEKQGTDDAASGKSDSEASEEQKRIRDLQSKADKAEARANKAEKALKAKTSSAKASEGTPPPEVQEWLKNTQDTFREDLFAEDARFKQFKLDPELIAGETPSDMRESQKTLIEFVDKMESQIRDSVLEEHGFAPAPKASERQDPVNYETMTSEEFAKHEQVALSGGVLKRSGA